MAARTPIVSIAVAAKDLVRSSTLTSGVSGAAAGTQIAAQAKAHFQDAGRATTSSQRQCLGVVQLHIQAAWAGKLYHVRAGMGWPA